MCIRDRLRILIRKTGNRNVRILSCYVSPKTYQFIWSVPVPGTAGTFGYFLKQPTLPSKAGRFLNNYLKKVEHFPYSIKLQVLTDCSPIRIFFRVRVWAIL